MPGRNFWILIALMVAAAITVATVIALAYSRFAGPAERAEQGVVRERTLRVGRTAEYIITVPAQTGVAGYTVKITSHPDSVMLLQRVSVKAGIGYRMEVIGDTHVVSALDVGNLWPIADGRTELLSLQVRGLAPGDAQAVVKFTSLDDDSGNPIPIEDTVINVVVQ